MRLTRRRQRPPALANAVVVLSLVISILLTACSLSKPSTVITVGAELTQAPPTPATQPPDPASASPGASTTPTPFTGTDVVLDCAAVYPGMPGCLRDTP